MTDELLSTIVTQYNGDSDLSGALNGMFFQEAPGDTGFPYCVFTWVAGTATHTMVSGYQNTIVQFAIWEDKYEADALSSHAKKLLAVFGDDETLKRFTSTNYTFVFSLLQTRSFAEENAWQWQADYNVLITHST